MTLHTECTIETRVISAEPGNIAEAAQLLRSGGVIAFPTETVYGLGANACDDHAVSSVFALKKRPQFNPLIVHVENWDHAAEFVLPNAIADNLARLFWPGGLTLVLPRRPGGRVSLLATAGLDTVAVRSPAHPVARLLLQQAATPIAAPSANLAGRLSPTSAKACLAELHGRVPLVLDGGDCQIGIESTVVGFSNGRPVLLRPGAITREDIETVTGPLSLPPRGSVSAPGMLASHYAPRARLRLNADRADPHEALLAYGPAFHSDACHVCNLSPAGDLREAAANLFSMLRQLDDTGVPVIAVMPIPATGLGEAINDRLARAAAPRQ